MRSFGEHEMRGDVEPNAGVEIHDSTLERIEPHGPDLVAVFHAYVHRSSGRPGIDAGTGWVQRLRLHFQSASATGDMSAIPMDLLGGRLILSNKVFNNVFPMPLDHEGPSRIELETWNDAKIVVEGRKLTAVFVGPAEYVEEFKP